MSWCEAELNMLVVGVGSDLLLVPLGDGGEYRLLRPLSLRGLVTDGDVCSGESGTSSSFTAESGLSGSGSEPLALTLALFLAALFLSDRSEFSIWKKTRTDGGHGRLGSARARGRASRSPPRGPAARPPALPRR